MNYVYEHEFVKWIKEGGYGKVFLAKHVLYKDTFVAIKKASIKNLSTDEIYNLSREAVYLQSFKHKNIIQFKNNFVYKDYFYTVMDHAAGGELNTYLYSKTLLSETEAKAIFMQIHASVAYIHSKKVIHRDIKPNNIMFLDENRENVVLIDFGISGYTSGNVKEVVKAGTLKFLPPEFASGLSYSSNSKFDVWSLGIVLFHMLFGILPFDGNIYQ
jgi:serine/threonine protein kinase